MGTYGQRQEPAYADVDLSEIDVDNPHMLKWWTPEHDRILEDVIRAHQWHWYWEVTDALVNITDEAELIQWRRSDPLCESYAWYNVLMYFARARARKKGLERLIRTPQTKRCALCEKFFREDSLPGPMVKRLGINQIDFCSPCVEAAVLQSGNETASEQSVRSYIRRLTDVLGRIPPSDFGRNPGDFHGMSTEERLSVLKVLRNKPSLERVKKLYGSWLNALVAAGVLEDDVRRTVLGTHCLATDGHICYSLGEKTIDDLLHSLGIKHEKEPPYPEGNFRADFLVSGSLIEYFGLSGDPEYDAKTKKKIEICKRHGINLIAIYPKDLSSGKSLRDKILRETGLG